MAAADTLNLAAWLVEAGQSEAPALRDDTRVVTYGELRDAVARAATVIAQRTATGDRVAITLGTTIDFVVVHLAAIWSGRISVPLNPSGGSVELGDERREVGASLTVDAATAYEIATAALGAAPMAAVATPAGQAAVLLFTSGTAGPPKPAILTHRNLAANVEQVQAVPDMALRADDVVFGVLPTFHIFGLNVVLGLALRAGACVSLSDRFDPRASLERIRRDGVTVLPGVPALFAAWCALADLDRTAFASVRLAVSGAAALSPETLAAARDRFGLAIHEGYGLTEAAPIVTSTAGATDLRPGSIGPPLPGVEVRLVDADGTDVLTDDPGEILVRGPNVFAGYWNDPDTTARVLDADGWLHTGDVVVADADGWLTLVDRTKDLIIVSGFNVYPAEVEDALLDHPEVADAAAVGAPDAMSGEHVVAFVVARNAAQPPTATQLTAHLRRRLARYKIPARFEFVSELPRTFAGKVVRRALRPEASTNPA